MTKDVNPNVRIEDNFEDALGKAMRGLSLSLEETADRAGVTTAAANQLLAGEFDEPAIRRMAPVLNLNEDCLVQLAKNAFAPKVVLPEGLLLHNSPFPVPGYEEMTVNSFSLVPPGQLSEGFLLDAGAPFQSIMQKRPDAINISWRLFLTHTHPDHVVNYDELSQVATNAYAPTGEHHRDASQVQGGDVFEIGVWRLTAIETPGHSPGGMTYLLEGPERPVAFVGDALFCRSIGKINGDYEAGLSTIRKKLLTLPDATILCPGHGPPTTVAFEKRNNPFFA